MGSLFVAERERRGSPTSKDPAQGRASQSKLRLEPNSPLLISHSPSASAINCPSRACRSRGSEVFCHVFAMPRPHRAWRKPRQCN